LSRIIIYVTDEFKKKPNIILVLLSCGDLFLNTLYQKKTSDSKNVRVFTFSFALPACFLALLAKIRPLDSDILRKFELIASRFGHNFFLAILDERRELTR
jgi:hypothetical protein